MKIILALAALTLAAIIVTDVLNSIELSYLSSTVPAFIFQVILVYREERRRQERRQADRPE